MPLSSKDIEQSQYLRLLVLGAPKCGKTQTCISSAEGPVYVINSDDTYSLTPAARVAKFDYDMALGRDTQGIETAIQAARTGVKEGKYKTIIWDTISRYSDRIVEVYAAATENAAGEPDGRRYWPMYAKHMHQIIDRLFMLKAHVVVLSHFIEGSNATIDGQVKKSGEGAVPGLGGKCRTTIPAEFQDIVFLEKKAGKRLFVTSSDGVFGPGCRSLPGVESVDANLMTLFNMMNGKAPKKERVAK